MKIPWRSMPLSQIRGQVQQMEEALAAGHKPEVNPYPASWTPDKIQESNSLILSVTDPRSSASVSGDMTLGDMADNKPKWSKARSTAAKTAGFLALGGVACVGASIAGVVGGVAALGGLALLAGSILPGSLAGGLGKASKAADDMVLWGKELENLHISGGSLSSQPATAELNGEYWNLA